ncbi:MAG: EFR1 family ferrodoxin [Spirochaetales bacterium]|nr:EFR1 family ferrodoxin [Spirochaetales bacterium]
MSTVLYYFSGTGNSLFVAKELQKLIPDTQLIPIVRSLKENNFVTNAESIGFVFPTHGLTIPIPVRTFVKKMDASSGNYFFAVATRGGTVFRGFPVINDVLTRHEKKLNASFIINMASNDPKLSFYNTASKEDIDHLQKNALIKLNEIKKIVDNKEDYHDDDKSGVTFSRNPMLNTFLEHLIPFMTHFLSPKTKKYFYSDSKCTGCGTCEKVCLSQKIKMRNKRPVWQKNITCYLCYSCLNYCPSKAIQIYSKIWMKSYTKEKGRYLHPYASGDDIAQQKKL